MPARAWDRNGVFVAGATAEFYEPGTTTPRTVYSNAALSVAHPSPLVADARGVFAPVYTSGPVKVVVKDPDGVVLPGGTLDPAFSSPASAASADAIAFDATGEIPETDVQAAIERVQINASALVAGAGWGVTGNAPLLADFGATTLESGAFRFDGTTAGTRPTGWVGTELGAALFLRDTGTSGLMLAADRANGVIWQRQMTASTWGAWLRLTPNTRDQATWNTGTDTTEAQISPAKLRAAMPAVDGTTLTGTFTTTSTTYTAITGLTAQITPKSATSRVRVTFTLSVGASANQPWYLRLTRNGTAIALGDAAGDREQVTMEVTVDSTGSPAMMATYSLTFLDEPASAEALTYGLEVRGANRSASPGTFYLNCTHTDTDAVSHARGISTIIVEEVLQ